MSTTSNIIAGATLATALVVGGIALSPEASDVAPDAGVADGGQQPLVGNFYLRFPDEATFLDAARQAGYWRPLMRKEKVCDRWGKDYIDGGMVDAGCIDYGTQLVPSDAGEVDLATMGHAFDLVGTIVVPRRDADGGIVPDGGSETLEGWHVNFSGVLPDEWKPFVVDPANPVRKMR